MMSLARNSLGILLGFALVLVFSGCGSDNVPPQVLAGFTVKAPTAAKSGQAFDVQISARSSGGGGLTGYRGTLVLSADDPTAALPAQYTFTDGDNGVHTFSETFRANGKHAIRAADMASNLDGSQFLDVTGNDAAKLVLVSGDGQSGTVTKPLGAAFAVKASDASGAPYPGLTITWAASAGGGSVVESTPTDMDGVAKVTAVLGKTAGANMFSATTANVPAVAFSATGTADAPAKVVAVSGDAQKGTGGAPLPTPFVAKVTDQYGNGVGKQTLAWAVASGGGAVSAATSASGDDGAVSVTGTLGLAPLTNTYTVTATGLPPVTFTATRNAYKLVYTNPTTGTVQLLKNSASSDGTVVLDFIAVTAPASAVYSAGFDLPLDMTKVALDPTAPITLTATPPLNPGTGSPRAVAAQLPTTGPLAGNLVAVVSQKASGTGAVATDTALTAGAVLYSVKLNVNPTGAPGVIFDGTGAKKAITSGGLLNKAGSSVVGPANVGIGKLELRP